MFEKIKRLLGLSTIGALPTLRPHDYSYHDPAAVRKGGLVHYHRVNPSSVPFRNSLVGEVVGRLQGDQYGREVYIKAEPTESDLLPGAKLIAGDFQNGVIAYGNATFSFDFSFPWRSENWVPVEFSMSALFRVDEVLK